MPSPFDRLRTEIDLSVRDITDNAFRLNTKDPDAPAKWMNTLNQAGMEKDVVTGSPPGTSFTQYFNETVAKSRSFMPPEVAEARLGDSGWAASETQAPFVDPDMDPNAFRNVMFGLNPIGGSAINLLTPREGGGNRVFTPQVPEGFFGSEENLGRLHGITEAAREITSPFDVLTSAALAGLGPAASAALQGTNRAGRIAARFIDPVTRGGLERRLAAETGVNLGGTFGALEAPKLLPEDAPTGLKIGVGIAGALAGGGGSIAAINAPRIGSAALRKGEQAAEAIGRTGVGNVLDPVPPQTVAGRVEDVGAAKPKLIAFNKELTKRLETEPLQKFDDQFPRAREDRVSTKLGRELTPEVSTAQTGEPFDAVLFRGFGREDAGSVFNDLNIEGNVLGEGTYTTPSAIHAANFGDEIEELRVVLQNPLVIRTDTEWRQLTRDAGLRFPKGFEEGRAAQIRTHIEALGHDGVIVQTGDDLINDVFGTSDTVLDFSGVRPDVTAAARQADAAAREVAEEATPVQRVAPTDPLAVARAAELDEARRASAAGEELLPEQRQALLREAEAPTARTLAPDEPTRRIEVGLAPYTEGEQRPTLAFTKTDREMTEDAIDLLNSGNPEKAKQGGELLKAVVEPARVLVRNIFDQAGFQNVELKANFGMFEGTYEPSFSFVADVPEDRVDEFTRLAIDTANTDLGQDSVILSSVVSDANLENARFGVAPEVGLPDARLVTGKVESGAPIELLEPSFTLRFTKKLSAAEYQQVSKHAKKHGFDAFSSHADDRGLNVVNLSAYNDLSTGADSWLENQKRLTEAIDGDPNIRATTESWQADVRRVRHYGVASDYPDPRQRPTYDEARGYYDSNQAQRRYEGDPQSLNDKNKDKRARQRIIDVIGVKSWNRLRRGNATHASDPKEARMADGLIDEAVDKDLSDLGASLAGGGKPPGRVVGQAPSTGDAPPPRGSDNALELDLDIPVHEKPSRAVMRRFEGARNEQSLEAEEFADTGNKLLKSLGLDPQRMDAATMRPVFEALHGERSLDSLSPELREVADHVIALRDLETEDMLKFLDNAQGEGYETYLAWDVKTLSDRIMATPDYLPRLWKEAEEQTVRKVGEGGVFGGTPRHAKARADASFSEMIDEHGFEPLSWNPMTMMAIRRMEGVMYREQVKLANQLNRLGKVLPLEDAPDGFRVPEIKSPVFNGRPIPVVADQSPERLLEIEEWAQAGGKDQFPGDIRMTKVLAVPNEVADQLELLYGRRMKAWLRLPFGREIDVFKLIDDFTNAAKRVAVFGTFYQHFDITRRAIFSRAASNIGLPKKSALKNIPTTPGFVWKLLKLQWVPSERAALRKRFLRNVKIAPEYPNSPTWREAVQEGTNIQGDTSYIKRETLQALDETARGSKIPLAGKALENYRLIRDFMESGLFDGIYRGGMEDSMERYVVPELCRQHPDWTSRQIAAEASNVTNEIFSALGNYQTVLSNPNLRRFASWLIFSTNESETLIRQALRVMNPRDPNGRIWRKWYLGIFFALALEANIKHYAATGEPLPPESYIPVNLNDPYAHMFGMHTGVSYNGKFLSPQVPLVRGRNGQPVYEDLMGQMDTSLRWATDPTGALASRLNRAPGAIWRQARGTSFRGQPLDSPIRKAVQLAQDIGLPFSSGGALELLVEKFPALRESIPIGETRLGATAGAIQTFGGINLRTLSTPELEDLIKSGDLTPEQKKSYRIEIETRKEERQRKGFFIPYDPQQGKPPPMSPAHQERIEKQLAR